ncbi:MAG: hypothetical protein QXX77_01655 [Candidatus Methanosuratincola sp.]
MLQIKREEIMKKVLSSVSAALAHAQALISSLGGDGNPGNVVQGPGRVASSELPAGPGGEGAATTKSSLQRAYASALRCRLEIQYALLLIQKGLSVEIAASAAPSSRSAQKAKLAAGLKADLEGALSALESGSPDGAGAKLVDSDSKAAQLISRIRGELKQSTRVKRRNQNQNRNE